MKNSIVLVDEPLPKLCVFQSYLSMFLEALAQKKKKKIYPKHKVSNCMQTFLILLLLLYSVSDFVYTDFISSLLLSSGFCLNLFCIIFTVAAKLNSCTFSLNLSAGFTSHARIYLNPQG